MDTAAPLFHAISIYINTSAYLLSSNKISDLGRVQDEGRTFFLA